MWSLGLLVSLEKPRTLPPATPQTTTVGTRDPEGVCLGRTESPWLSTSSLNQLPLSLASSLLLVGVGVHCLHLVGSGDEQGRLD